MVNWKYFGGCYLSILVSLTFTKTSLHVSPSLHYSPSHVASVSSCRASKERSRALPSAPSEEVPVGVEVGGPGPPPAAASGHTTSYTTLPQEAPSSWSEMLEAVSAGEEDEEAAGADSHTSSLPRQGHHP
nr:uncharacterized protein LOC128693721 [Cherax quadricarinatus]